MKGFIEEVLPVVKLLAGLAILMFGAVMVNEGHSNGIWLIFGTGGWLGYSVGTQTPSCKECGSAIARCCNKECDTIQYR